MVQNLNAPAFFQFLPLLALILPDRRDENIFNKSLQFLSSVPTLNQRSRPSHAEKNGFLSLLIRHKRKYISENGIDYKFVSFNYTKAKRRCKVSPFSGEWSLKSPSSLESQVFRFPLPVRESQRVPVYSIRSDESRSSRSRALGCWFYPSTSVSGSSGTPPMLASPWTGLLQSPLGKWMHPMTPLDRDGHLHRGAQRDQLSDSGNSKSL